MSPWVTPALLVAGLWLVARLWIGARRRWVRVSLAVAALLLGAATFLARQNHFEWMFQPLAQPQFASASRATGVDEKDMVLALEIDGQARAYPVRQMAYHHVLNDVVAGEPVVVTY